MQRIKDIAMGLSRLAVARWRIELPEWAGRAPLSIAAVGDPHIGGVWMGARELARIADRARELKPDMLVLLGDYVADSRMVRRQHDADTIADLLRPFAKDPPPLGVWSILGNHDWKEHPRLPDGRPPMWPALEQIGIPVLENRAVRLDHGGPFWLVGLGSQRARKHDPGPEMGSDDLPGALDGTEDGAPRLLLAHEPDIFPDIEHDIPFMLSGHTHGGQIRPFGRPIWMPSRHGTRYAYGRFDAEGPAGQRTMIVSGGVGCSGIPLRWRMDPEITLVRIEGPSAA
ncbi:MAG: metallophosphoesterase [Pseudomonadota bacterium]